MELEEFKKKALAIRELEKWKSRAACELPAGTEFYKSSYDIKSQDIYVLTTKAKLKTRDFDTSGIIAYTYRPCRKKNATPEERKREQERAVYRWNSTGSLYIPYDELWKQKAIRDELVAWMNKVTPNFDVVKEKGIIVFTNRETKEMMRCDLNAQTFFRTYKKRKGQHVRYPAQFFKYVIGRLLIAEIGAADCQTFKTLVELVAKNYSKCRNFGTFLVRMFDHIHLEEYIAAGVPFDFSIPFAYSDFDKNIRKKIDEHSMTYSMDIGSLFCSDKDTGRAVFAQIENCVNFKNMVMLLAHNIQPLNTLVNHYNYDLKTLFEYCRKNKWYVRKPARFTYYTPTELQNPETEDIKHFSSYNYDIVSFLRDYSRMALDVYGDNYDKYPADLHAAHEECNRIYQTRKVEIDQKRFAETIDKSLEWKNDEFEIIYPKASDEVVAEGKALRHCVGSYIQSVVRGECKILFLRKKDELEKPFVTIEISGGNIRQARGYGNSAPIYDAKMALQDYAKSKKLLYRG